jgi:uncharacterized membrane protein (DUF106 family)
MTTKSTFDVKTVLLILGFLGVTSIGTVFTAGRKVLGWLTMPAIESANAALSIKVDSLQAIRFETFRAYVKAENIDTRASIDDLRETMAEVPAVQEAAKRRKARQKALHDLELRREVANSTNSNGDRN